VLPPLGRDEERSGGERPPTSSVRRAMARGTPPGGGFDAAAGWVHYRPLV